MKRKNRLYLSYADWSAADKALWTTIFQPGIDLFDEQGPGSYLAERSIQQLQYAYGKFLPFYQVSVLICASELLRDD